MIVRIKDERALTIGRSLVGRDGNLCTNKLHDFLLQLRREIDLKALPWLAQYHTPEYEFIERIYKIHKARHVKLCEVVTLTIHGTLQENSIVYEQKLVGAEYSLVDVHAVHVYTKLGDTTAVKLRYQE